MSIVRAERAAIQRPPTVKNAATRQVKPTPTTPFKRHSRRRRAFIATAVLIALVSIAYVIARRPAPEHGTDTRSDIEEPAPSANSRADKPLDSTSGGFTIVAPAADTSRTADPRPRHYNSPPTGTRFKEDIAAEGHGELTVENGTTEDAVARLSDVVSDETACWFFIRARSSAHMTKIPSGIYRLRFTTGLDWVESKDIFKWHPSYSEFDRDFRYNEQPDSEGIQYHSISVTLHPVIAGNVRTKGITREQFLKGYHHSDPQR